MADLDRQEGAWRAKLFVTEYLKKDIPDRLVDFRNAWQLDNRRLPDPVQYLNHEPPALDQWPCVHTIQMSTRSIIRDDYTNYTTDPVYRVTYSFRTYVWCNGEAFENVTAPEITTENRDRLTAVVRSALLDHPSMTTSADAWFPYNADQALIDERTMREEYSELSLAKGGRYIAGAYLAYDITLYEPIKRLKNGDVASFAVTTVPLAR